MLPSSGAANMLCCCPCRPSASSVVMLSASALAWKGLSAQAENVSVQSRSKREAGGCEKKAFDGSFGCKKLLMRQSLVLCDRERRGGRVGW